MPTYGSTIVPFTPVISAPSPGIFASSISVTGGSSPTFGAWTTVVTSMPYSACITEVVGSKASGTALAFIEIGIGPAGFEKPLFQLPTGTTTGALLPYPSPPIPAGSRVAARVAGAAIVYTVSVAGFRLDAAAASGPSRTPQLVLRPNALTILAGANTTLGATTSTLATVSYPFIFTGPVSYRGAGGGWAGGLTQLFSGTGGPEITRQWFASAGVNTVNVAYEYLPATCIVNPANVPIITAASAGTATSVIAVLRTDIGLQYLFPNTAGDYTP